MENETLARVNADETARSNYVESGSSGLRTVFGVVLLGISLLLFLTLALGALSDFGHLLARLGGEGRPALYFDLISSSITMLPWAIPFILASAAWRTLCSTRGLGDFARISLISALVGFF
ncbi:MAG: hypothetical protein IJM30_11710 [Thermoguttaceae bacterium]|nr:hypothetical protein [Thermoguttaceae bacterium]